MNGVNNLQLLLESITRTGQLSAFYEGRPLLLIGKDLLLSRQPYFLSRTIITKPAAYNKTAVMPQRFLPVLEVSYSPGKACLLTTRLYSPFS